MLFACLKWCFFDSPCNWGRAPRWETPAECVLVVVRVLKHLSGTSSCNYNQLYVCFAVCFHVFHWYFVLSPWVGSPDYVRGPTSMCTGVGNCWDLRSWIRLKHGFLIYIHLKPQDTIDGRRISSTNSKCIVKSSHQPNQPKVLTGKIDRLPRMAWY